MNHDDELDHFNEHLDKQRQARFFDGQSGEDFEVARPHGAPKLYRWLMGEKLRRSVIGVTNLLTNATALTVCGGSGMDAEFLERCGSTVITSDISIGAARRAVRRSKRFGLNLTSIVADVERLPFADASIDIVYVHDGLHHLARPSLGLAEMARVASKCICITEPAEAAITKLAVKLGLAKQYEDAGNRVARIRVKEIARILRQSHFRLIHAERYAMYYPHKPGRVFRILSAPGIFSVVRLSWQVLNGLIGRLGNKLTITGTRL